MEREVTQGGPVSPTIFNIVVNSVVRAVLMEFCRPQEAYHGLVWVVGEHNIIFYAEYINILVSNPIWVQTTLAELVMIF